MKRRYIKKWGVCSRIFQRLPLAMHIELVGLFSPSLPWKHSTFTSADDSVLWGALGWQFSLLFSRKGDLGKKKSVEIGKSAKERAKG